MDKLKSWFSSSDSNKSSPQAEQTQNNQSAADIMRETEPVLDDTSEPTTGEPAKTAPQKIKTSFSDRFSSLEGKNKAYAEARINNNFADCQNKQQKLQDEINKLQSKINELQCEQRKNDEMAKISSKYASLSDARHEKLNKAKQAITKICIESEDDIIERILYEANNKNLTSTLRTKPDLSCVVPELANEYKSYISALKDINKKEGQIPEYPVIMVDFSDDESKTRQNVENKTRLTSSKPGSPPVLFSVNIKKGKLYGTKIFNNPIFSIIDYEYFEVPPDPNKKTRKIVNMQSTNPINPFKKEQLTGQDAQPTQQLMHQEQSTTQETQDTQPESVKGGGSRKKKSRSRAHSRNKSKSGKRKK